MRGLGADSLELRKQMTMFFYENWFYRRSESWLHLEISRTETMISYPFMEQRDLNENACCLSENMDRAWSVWL